MDTNTDTKETQTLLGLTATAWNRLRHIAVCGLSIALVIVSMFIISAQKPVNTDAAGLYTFTGTGTESNPYQIRNVADLRGLHTEAASGEAFVGKFFKQTANISAADRGDGIGLSSPIANFSGTYDGANYKISDLTVNDNGMGSNTSGLFAMTNGATLKNIVIVESNIRSTVTDGGESGTEYIAYVGGLVGHATNTDFINCRVDATVEAVSYDYGTYSTATNIWAQAPGACAGGLVGYSTGGSITNCATFGTVISAGGHFNIAKIGTGVTALVDQYMGGRGGSTFCGGIVGYANNTPITGSSSSATLNARISTSISNAQHYKCEACAECIDTFDGEASYTYTDYYIDWSYTRCSYIGPHNYSITHPITGEITRLQCPWKELGKTAYEAAWVNTYVTVPAVPGYYRFPDGVFNETAGKSQEIGGIAGFTNQPITDCYYNGNIAI
jgi:hypothetical protein